MKKRIGMLLLCLLLPTAALAVQEGAIEPAEPIALDEIVLTGSAYLPDESYYTEHISSRAMRRMPSWAESDVYTAQRHVGIDGMYLPQLTPGEIRRAKALMQQAERGEIALTGGDAIIGVRENVTMGVYPLDPAAYDGERVYVLLPGVCLTDEQLIALMDAYAQLGLGFDPEGLGVRNCMRGGGKMASRPLSAEEGERRGNLEMLLQRGIIDPSQADGQYGISLNPSQYLLADMGNGQLHDVFQLYPYRSVSDEALLYAAITLGTRDLSGEMDLQAVENRAYAVLTGKLSLPPTLVLEEIYSDRQFSGEEQPVLVLCFGFADAASPYTGANVRFDQNTLVMLEVQLTGEGKSFEVIDLREKREPEYGAVGGNLSDDLR